ncbi:hypothetical protein A2U01_0098804, partial [Trifolium medium]|nr:hypothetical protein [Trifolium medium]
MKEDYELLRWDSKAEKTKGRERARDENKKI